MFCRREGRVRRLRLGFAVACIVLVIGLSPVSECAAQGTRMNNLVTELKAFDSLRISGTRRIEFVNPRDGWVYFGVTALDHEGGSFEVVLEEAGADIVQGFPEGGRSVEAMRMLTEGAHVLIVRSAGEPRDVALVIRTMPETHFVRYPQEPRYPQLGGFSWEWLNEHVLSSVNTLVGIPGEGLDEIIDDWTARGRKVIAYGSLPHQEDISGEETFDYWSQNPGFQDARFGGLIADEFQGRQHPLYPAWTEGMRRLGLAYRGTGKKFYAYCGGPGMYTRPETRGLVRTVFDADFRMAWERYHHEMPTLAEAEELMDELLGKEMKRWQAVFPECQKKMVLVLGIFATGPDLDVQPNVDYKVWMDMQMQYLATHPLYDGLFGVHWWYSGAASEELLRWQSALYRHYCIEGQTQLLSERYGWTYETNHIQNPDFYDGFEGWTTQPATRGSMRTGYLERYARIQNRYWHRNGYPDDPAGNTYAWMKRSADAPNRLSQTLRGLVPGKLYTVQLITADYEDIVNGFSEIEKHAVAMTVSGAEAIPALSYSSVETSSGWSHPQLPFENGPARFNHHRVTFRATRPTAELHIADWNSIDGPGGPIGQELMLNYVQVQPYFELED